MQAIEKLITSIGNTGANDAPASLSTARAFTSLRNSSDAWLIAASFVFIAAVPAVPHFLTVGIGSWWLLNTTSHNFIHQPFFERRGFNRIFAVYLSVVTLVPAEFWRQKHLAHHGGRGWTIRFDRDAPLHTAAVLMVWIVAFTIAPRFAVTTLLPGFCLSMSLCFLHGYFEHAAGTTSYYGRIYNILFFNDGFHREHHAQPGLHWTKLSAAPEPRGTSQYPAILRWFSWINLNGLEMVLTHSSWLQRVIVQVHERAVRKVMQHRPAPGRIAIIGGGIFPRTARVAHAIWPEAEITIWESNDQHLALCRKWLRGDERLVHARVIAEVLPDADLIFIPLAFDHGKNVIYENYRGNALVLVHEWIWMRRVTPTNLRSAIVSIFLLKRVNLLSP